MTFDQFRAIKRPSRDPWDINHRPRRIERPLRFVRHQGRVFQVLFSHQGLLKVETISGHYQTKILHELDCEVR